MIRLMVADDHAILRDGLKQLFALVDDVAVAAEAANGTDVLDLLRDGGIDLVLLDMSVPGISGEDLIVRLRTRHPALPILALSMRDEPQQAQRALKAGANGFVGKDVGADMLLAAVRKVAAGGRFLDPQIAEQVAFEATGAGNAVRHGRLSGREFQIMRLLASGAGIKAIADQLSISNKTVSTHKARLMEKMGFESSAQLIRYAIDHRIVD